MSSPYETQGPDLNQVAEPERREVWDAWVRASFPGLALKALPASAPIARGVTLGAAQLWSFQAAARTCVHGLVRKGGDGGFVHLQLEGTTRMTGRDREWRVAPGEICIGKMIEGPFELETESASRHVIVELPWSSIASRHMQLARAPFRLIESNAPAADLLRDMTSAMIETAGQLHPQQRQLTLSAWIQLLGVPDARAQDSAGNTWRVLRACAEIERRLHEPELDAEALASQQRISRRRLDELFVAATKRPLTAYITRRRLERAAELLHDPAEAEQSIAAIASRLGFQHASHFTRVFKAHWQVTPKAWRARKLQM